MALAAEHTVTINRAPDEVFGFVADGRNGLLWRSGVLDVDLVSGQGLGAVYRQGVKGPGGRRIAADYKITAWEPGRRLAFQAIAGPVRPSGEYRFEAADGGTRLTFSLAAELNPIQRLLLGRAVRQTMDAEVNATEKLKTVIEGQPASQAAT